MSCGATAQDKTIYKGQTATFLLTVTDEDEERFNLDGSTLYFRIKLAVTAADPALVALETGSGIVHATQSGTTLGQATITVPAASTAALTDINYVYDVWLEKVSGDKQPIVPVSKLTVSIPVTNL